MCLSGTSPSQWHKTSELKVRGEKKKSVKTCMGKCVIMTESELTQPDPSRYAGRVEKKKKTLSGLVIEKVFFSIMLGQLVN